MCYDDQIDADPTIEEQLEYYRNRCREFERVQLEMQKSAATRDNAKLIDAGIKKRRNAAAGGGFVLGFITCATIVAGAHIVLNLLPMLF